MGVTDTVVAAVVVVAIIAVVVVKAGAVIDVALVDVNDCRFLLIVFLLLM